MKQNLQTSLPVINANTSGAGVISEAATRSGLNNVAGQTRGDFESSGPPRQHLLNLSEADFKIWLTANGEKPFRARQVFNAIFQHRVRDFDEVTELSKKLREKLSEHFVIYQSGESAVVQSSDGTDKLLVRLADGGEVECVLLRDGKRRSICISSQVGCAMGAFFAPAGSTESIET